jgi:troponin T
VESARNDLLKSKEQLEEEKKISLSFRIKPLEIDGLGASNNPVLSVFF